jgi:hypothetical protein
MRHHHLARRVQQLILLKRENLTSDSVYFDSLSWYHSIHSLYCKFKETSAFEILIAILGVKTRRLFVFQRIRLITYRQKITNTQNVPLKKTRLK